MKSKEVKSITVPFNGYDMDCRYVEEDGNMIIIDLTIIDLIIRLKSNYEALANPHPDLYVDVLELSMYDRDNWIVTTRLYGACPTPLDGLGYFVAAALTSDIEIVQSKKLPSESLMQGLLTREQWLTGLWIDTWKCSRKAERRLGELKHMSLRSE